MVKIEVMKTHGCRVADQGALVTAQYNSSSDALASDAELQRFLQAGNHGRPALHLVQSNVTDEASVDRMFESAESAIGAPVAVLVGERGF